jgi:predicted ferric reductase
MFRLPRIPSILFIIVYLMGTLFLRFVIEFQLQGAFLISLTLGAFCLLFLWAMIRSGFLNPGWFNWEKKMG